MRSKAPKMVLLLMDFSWSRSPGNSSVPRPDNAIYDLARGLLGIERYQFPVMANDLTRSYFAAVGQVETGPIAPMLRRFAADPNDAEALAAIRAEPEYANKLATTCVATMLNAGHAENALPQRAEATVNCRIFPGVSVDSVKAELDRVIGDPSVSVTKIEPIRPVAVPPPLLDGGVGTARHATLAPPSLEHSGGTTAAKATTVAAIAGSIDYIGRVA